MVRSLPTIEEAARIFAARRTRPPRRPPPAAARALHKTIKMLDARFGQGADGLKARWTEIVGKTLARHTEPGRLVKPRNGDGATLELRVNGPSATLIQHQAPDVLARVNLFLGAGAVTRLRIVQGPLRGVPTRAPVAVRLSNRRLKTPLDAADEQRLAADLAALPEGGLKMALEKLGREVMRATPKRNPRMSP